MKNLFLFLTLLVLSVSVNAQQEKQQDTTKTQQLDEVLVKAVRVDADSPITHSNVSKAEIQKRNLGQDVPILLNYLPSVVTTSDAGAGIGYTGIRVRGTDATRVNVTINGIPYNDPESQGTFWVNLGDIASSTESIQLQRGVGTSTNGSGAFGASLNLLTDVFSEEASAEISNSFGSFNTRKHTVKLSTGLLNDHFEFSGRLSKIDSDGYIDRAFTDLKSYFLQGIYKDENTLIKALTFGNVERTYQAWYGLTKEELEEDRRQNPYTYDNETDNYWQDHYQLHWNQRYNNNWSTNLGLNYTKGKGYFEQYKEEEAAADFSNLIEDDSDVIVRRWLDSDFYVLNANVVYKKDALEVISGISYSSFTNDHFGEVIWGSDLAPNTQIRDRYYDGDATKNDFSVFSKATFKLAPKFTGFVDLQGRFVSYKTNGINSDLNEFVTDADFSFFNPKLGLTYKSSEKNSYYISYARANREPNRDDFKAGVTDNETLNDIELGWRYANNKVNVNTNLYYMFYQNQLVLTGELDDVGSPIRATSGESYRLGLEVDANIAFNSKFSTSLNVAVSQNKNQDFTTSLDGEFVNLGNTNISFSPELVIGNAINFMPTKNLQISFLSKYVGEQYMGNIDSENSKLDSYFVNDLNVNYQIKPNKLFKSIVFSGLVNNVFNKEYVSNGFYGTYDDTWSVPGQTTTLDYAGYYPQATINFLLGMTLKF
ncbi:iron complex outermembrane receptor protein [Mesoflavibacter sabulilitoris]|uniref:TonB-dependent receptor n=1 Tax=Mesoflavibacter zeaxanthinifaciens subsp. sabulilitoris TaxID=1520893 RepID=A0A2T1N757_9FLAO|nr:TonB-dependent receptor [Mesoflavibacter zeaxanthinifaciens]MBB3124133.1 iron complex outermembrane receptor protein [Mesoflavibacter zeaxanthinifaciens subsp. sabulilitoris]PSG87704.1 TonB-dependent receptor [Mesoflavibacter zeaxanthinifaciens subsp. sabulilitoris]